jgi:Tat protein translocase TatB subunit
MLDFSFAELLLVVIVAVVFIQPKDMPVIIRAIAKAMHSIRNLSHEVKQAFDDVARETGLHDTRKTLDAELRMIQGDDGKMYESYDIKNIIDKPAVKHDEPGS